jgi:hypothetical protein
MRLKGVVMETVVSAGAGAAGGIGAHWLSTGLLKLAGWSDVLGTAAAGVGLHVAARFAGASEQVARAISTGAAAVAGLKAAKLVFPQLPSPLGEDDFAGLGAYEALAPYSSGNYRGIAGMDQDEVGGVGGDGEAFGEVGDVGEEVFNPRYLPRC